MELTGSREAEVKGRFLDSPTLCHEVFLALTYIGALSKTYFLTLGSLQSGS